MLRLTELRLPLEHSDAALHDAVVARLGVDAADLRAFTVFRRGYDARKKSAIVFVYTIDCDVADEAAVLARHAGDPHVRPAPDTGYRFAAHAPGRFRHQRPSATGRGRLRAVRHLRRAAPRPDGPPAARSRARQGRARAHEGHLGPVAARRPRSGVERAVRRGRRRHLLRRQALEPDQRPAPPDAQGHRRVRRRRRARGDPLRRQAAHRHVPAGRRGRAHAPRDRAARRRGPLRRARRRPAHRGRRGARPHRHAVDAARSGRACRRAAARDRRRARRHRPGAQRARHVRDAARARRSPRGQAVLDRLSHRAPAVADRQGPLRAERRPSAPRRGRLSPRPSREERTRRLQLLHVPRRHRRRRDLGAGARRHQWHEPVFAQRAQRQRRHRRRHRADGLRAAGVGAKQGSTGSGRRWRRRRRRTRRRRHARRHRLPALLGVARVRARRRRLSGAGTARRRLPARPALDGVRQRAALLPAGRRVRRPRCRRTLGPARLRDRSDPRSACPRSSARSRDSPWTTPC